MRYADITTRIVLGLALCVIFFEGCFGGRIAGSQGQSSTANNDGPTGNLVMHRLNKVEYNNSVRDLLRTSLTPADNFPPDDISHGFDSIADALNTSPAAIHLYAQAAQTLAFEAMNPNSAAYATLRICAPQDDAWETCSKNILANFAAKAWRRPVSSAETDALYAVVNNAKTQGLDDDDSIAIGLSNVLLSPYFVYRLESQPTSNASTTRVSDYEMAARLSYFLWSTTPDDVLLDLARQEKLHTDEDLRLQLDRMLADSRSTSFVDNFVGQWLRLRDISASSPDTASFPNYTPAVGLLMVEETKHLFQHFLDADLPVPDMLTANYTFLNDALATYYGLPAPGTSNFVQVALAPTTGRQGLTTQGSILTVTSHPDAGSPVLRGKFILAQLLCHPPPAPPANVPSLPDQAASDAPQTMRQRISQHVTDPVCSSCHLLIDPPGFALEGFDAVGKLRKKDNGLPIDTTGTMLDGTSFTDIRDLTTKLSQRTDFGACLAEFLYVYATGRSMQDSDTQHLSTITTRLAAEGFTTRKLLNEIVLSDGFRNHKPNATGAQ